MVVPTVLLLIAGGFVVHAQQFEPFNENSISLDGLFDEEFDSINPVTPPSTQPAEETTVPLPPQTTESPVESIKAFNHFVQQANSPAQGGLIFDEVEFPAEVNKEESREETKEDTREETREESSEESEGEFSPRPEQGKNGGISIFRPLREKSNEKKKKSGSTGWSHKRKRLVRKGTKILRAKWTVVPENISTRRPHFQRKRRVLTRVSHVKPVHAPTLHIPSSKTRSVFRPAPLSRLNKPQRHSGSRERPAGRKLGISRSRSRESEEERGPNRQIHSDRRVLSRVARTDERQDRGVKKMREEQPRSFKENIKSDLQKINKVSEQIQVNSARQRFEYALDRNAVPQRSSPLPFHPLSSSSFSHFSPRPLLLPPLRTTQLSSSHRHRLNAHSPPVLLHRLHDGDWQRLRLLQRAERRRIR